MVTRQSWRRWTAAFGISLALGPACGDDGAQATESETGGVSTGTGTTGGGNPTQEDPEALSRIELIQQVVSGHGIINTLPFAAVARHESGGLRHCWSEAEWGCKGPPAPECDDGPILVRPVAGACDTFAGFGIFQVEPTDPQAATVDILSERGNVEAGVQRILDSLWNDTYVTPEWATWDEMIEWINLMELDSPEYDTWLSALAIHYHEGHELGPRTAAYLHEAYRASGRGLLVRYGEEFWEPEAIGISNANCACAQGLYHNGDPIPVEQTHCGQRVCGLDGVFECTSEGWKAVNGLTCGQGDCSCAQGINHLGDPIATQHTECHLRVCSLEGTFFECEPGGWSNMGVTCPLEADPNVSCKCTNGIDENNNPIDPNATHCGMEVCGLNNEKFTCTPTGWSLLGACDDPMMTTTGTTGGTTDGSTTDGTTGTGTGSTTTGTTGDDSGDNLLTFGYPVGDKTTSPVGGAPWTMWQTLGNYFEDYSGNHLANDIWQGEDGATEPIYAVADGRVIASAPNGSSYMNIVLIEHEMGDGTFVCSFYGHLDERYKETDELVTRGEQIASMMDQGGATHLHYAIVPEATCDYMLGTLAGSKCGYDGSTESHPGVLWTDPASEPYLYTASGVAANDCSMDGLELYSPSQFIDAHHY